MADLGNSTKPAPAEDMHATARALGLDRLSEEHLAQLARATAALKRHLDRLPGDLPPSAEPASVFRTFPDR